MTTIYFAMSGGGNAMESARLWDWDARPLAVLVSFAYLRNWQTAKTYFRRPRRLMLDSGAFSAYQLGWEIDHDALLAEAATPQWDEAVGLDVIGSWEGSLANAQYALARGVTKAMPVFHIGDPWHVLDFYRANFPKVGLSCRFGESVKTSMRFYEQCFARAWPHRFHSFGWVQDDPLAAFPFHSADAATWAVAPTAYRNWLFKRRGRYVQQHLSVEGRQMLTYGVQNHMEAMYRREQQLLDRWADTLAKLEGDPA